MKLLSWLVFFLLFVCREQVEGQQVCIEKYKPAINHELFFTLYALETDSNGYVYLATDNGIFVYNGSVVEKHKVILTQVTLSTYTRILRSEFGPFLTMVKYI